MMIHHMGYKLRAQIHRFSGKLCSRMGKVTQRFVDDMLYGKKARGSVRLSEVARSPEETISLKKVIERLSRNLARRGCAQGIAKAVLKERAVKVKEDTLLILDPTDITKKYATKMEYLAQVRDGSDKVLGSSEITPLVLFAYYLTGGFFFW